MVMPARLVMWIIVGTARRVSAPWVHLLGYWRQAFAADDRAEAEKFAREQIRHKVTVAQRKKLGAEWTIVGEFPRCLARSPAINTSFWSADEHIVARGGKAAWLRHRVAGR
jgi:hypothetical protein